MTESIKQEIINNIFENGDKLITGPILQTVLIDMIDDVNVKDQAILSKTGSWDEAVTQIPNLATKGEVTNLSESIARDLENVVDVDLTGYATEQWVESQGYLKEHQDISNLATKTELTEAENNLQGNITSLSESVARDLANVSVPEGVATEAWVQSQDYASKSYVDNAVSSSSVDLTGYATETWVQNQGYLTEHQDISNLATKSELTSVSESVQTDITNLSESVASSVVWKKGTGTDSIVQVLTGDNEANKPKATGVGAIATGEYTNASGRYSHVEGWFSGASGSHSHAEGSSANAKGDASHAEGYHTVASGSHSHAEGTYANAKGESSHAEGYFTIASNDSEHAQGRYNHNSENQIFSIGTGNNEIDRRNAVSVLEVDNSGSYTSSLFVQNIGGYDGTNPEPGTNDLATVINNLPSGGGSSETLWKKGTGEDSLVQKLTGNNEANTSTATGTGAIAIGSQTTASGLYSYAEGDHTVASGTCSHAEGNSTKAEGFNSHAKGYGTKASGMYSNAEGYNATASGDASHAEGESAEASGWGSHAEGSNTLASGSHSHAEGSSTNASGSYSHAEGTYTTASGYYSHAEGDNTKAEGESSHAEGYKASATGRYGHAEGDTSIASGLCSHAEGQSTLSSGQSSHAEGFNTIASNDYEHAQGQYNHNSTNQIFSVGAGEKIGETVTRRNAVSILEVPNSDTQVVTASFFVQNVGGYDGTNPEPGTNDLATVINNLPSGGSSETLWKKGTGTDSIVQAIASETDQPTATEERAIATGKSTTASGRFSHAEGESTKASGESSHAEGYSTTTSGGFSHAEGSRTNASRAASHAEGYGTVASGVASHAEGNISYAPGEASHAEGDQTEASGYSSHAEGGYTKTSNTYEHAQGRYNYTSSNQIFSIGTGNSNTDRRNAVSVLEVDNSGSYTSSFFVQNIGGYDGTNPEPGTNDLATVINGMSSGGGSSETLWKKGTGTDSVVQILTGNNEARTSTATEIGAVAVGAQTTASGQWSYAEGSETKASNYASHAEGQGTNALGPTSHAEGFHTTASGNSSHAEGVQTIATNPAEHAQGRFNLSSANQIFSVGAGDSIKDPDTQVVTETRRNAISVLSVPNSETQINTASFFVQNIGGYDGTNPIPGTNDLATVINNLPSGGGSSSGGSSETLWKKGTAQDSIVQILSGDNEAKTPTATKLGAIAIGSETTASGQWSYAEGLGTTAEGWYSHAEGRYAVAAGLNSHAEGYYTNASNNYEHAQGQYNHNSPNQIFSIGAGENAIGTVTRRNAVSVLAVPNSDTRILTSSFFVQNVGGYDGTNPLPGTNDLATVISGLSSSGGSSETLWKKGTGTDSIVQILTEVDEARKPTATGTGSIATGYYTVASGDYSHAEGHATTASGSYSRAEGNLTIASGTKSHAEGDHAKASGDYSHAEGSDTSASGWASHAEGYGTKTLKSYGHAEGYRTEASGKSSHAEGDNTKAEGEASHAEGYLTTTAGNYSHAEGYCTSASNNYEHAQGIANYNSTNQIFSVGAGEVKDYYNVTRRNALSVLSVPNSETQINTASVFIQNIGGYDGTNPLPGTNDLATVLNNTETWTFTLEDGSTVTKNIVMR